MRNEHLKEDIEKATSQLIKMVKNSSWNNISENYLYIISKIQNHLDGNTVEKRIERNKRNKLKKPVSLNEIILELENIYSNLYDINLFIYNTKKKSTIIEIRYYPKSALEKDYFESIKENKPMLHCKIPIPPYLKQKDQKFDINWELRGIRYRWNFVLWRIRIKFKKALNMPPYR